jgi:hypothetical protein
MFPFFDPNRILLHSSSMQKYMVRVNKLDNNIPTHTRTYTHIAPGPGVEAHDAARASRGVCGQLLRRAAETPEHVTPGHRDTGRHHIYETNVPETRFWYLNLFTICPSHYVSGCGEARSGGRSAPLKLTNICI